MSEYTKFREACFAEPGFYMIRVPSFTDGVAEIPCWCDKPTKHSEHSTSFFAVTENTRDKKTCHDFGRYYWIWSDRWTEPISWRRLSDMEECLLKSKLYQFNREKWK